MAVGRAWGDRGRGHGGGGAAQTTWGPSGEEGQAPPFPQHNWKIHFSPGATFIAESGGEAAEAVFPSLRRERRVELEAIH